MTALHIAQSAYAAAGTPTRTSRGTEYEVIARITSRLKAADAEVRRDKARNFPKLVAALHENLQLWTILAADVADPGNRLPPTLRARIFYLYEFTSHHSQEVLGTGQGTDVLIDINTAILRGLRDGGEPG